MAAPLAGEVGDLAADPLEVADLAADVLHQELARRVEADPARQALEDLRAELGLEGLDAPVERRGGDVQVLGRLADRAGPGDVLDQAQRLQMSHARTPCAQCAAKASYLIQRINPEIVHPIATLVSRRARTSAASSAADL